MGKKRFEGLTAEQLLLGVCKHISRMDGVQEYKFLDKDKIWIERSYADGPGTSYTMWQCESVLLVQERYLVAYVKELAGGGFLTVMGYGALPPEYDQDDRTRIREHVMVSGIRNLYKVPTASRYFAADRLCLKGKNRRPMSWYVLEKGVAGAHKANTARSFYWDFEETNYDGPFAVRHIAMMAGLILENIEQLVFEEADYQWFEW